jgi:hypothetical protein
MWLSGSTTFSYNPVGGLLCAHPSSTPKNWTLKLPPVDRGFRAQSSSALCTIVSVHGTQHHMELQGEDSVNYIHIGESIDAVLQRVQVDPQGDEEWFVAKDIIAAKKPGKQALRFLVTYEGCAPCSRCLTTCLSTSAKLSSLACLNSFSLQESCAAPH